MKTIKLKTVKVHLRTRSNEKKIAPKEFKYFDWIYDALLDTGQSGLPFKEMRSRDKLLNKMETLKGDKLELEDTEFGILKKVVNAMTWRVCATEITEFVEYINSFEK